VTVSLTDFSYVVKAVSRIVSLPRLMTARVSVMWRMRPSLMDGQALDNVHEASPATSFATTQAADVPEAQNPAASLGELGGSNNGIRGCGPGGGGGMSLQEEAS
jgi:hypothetical protein